MSRGAFEPVSAGDHAPVVPNVAVADRLWSRFAGLMGRRSFGREGGLLFPSCNAVHTMFMRFPIDVVFMDGGGKVIQARSRLRPWRLAGPVSGAVSALELPQGEVDRLGIRVGSALRLESGRRS